ncbi:MAG: YerC/YecD family TrpR-related protein [Patescibacteria group bacterium]
MGKFTNHKKLNKEDVEALFVEFAVAISSVKNSIEAANLIRDLLSEQEAIMLARRLQIARYLNDGLTYADIREEIKVSDPTISRVQTWLQNYGDGFRMVIERTRQSRKIEKESLPWDRLKHSYPMYFWPQILLKQIVSSANKKEKQKLLNVVNQMKEKTKLAQELKVLLRQSKEGT